VGPTAQPLGGLLASLRHRRNDAVHLLLGERLIGFLGNTRALHQIPRLLNRPKVFIHGLVLLGSKKVLPV
jgi:hypothetical protein